MNWKNLKDNACPKCTGMLQIVTGGYECSHNFGHKPCDFKISKAKFDSIIESMYRPRRALPYDNEINNLEKLNNL